MPDLQPLYQRAAMIRDAVLKWENTANRVGSLFYDIITQIKTIESSYFLRKDAPDTATELITFQKGIKIGEALFTWDAESGSLKISESIYSLKEVSAYGAGSGAGTGGTVGSLGGLANVGLWADEVPASDRIMVQLAGATHWSSMLLSEIVGLDTTALANYLTTNNYATKNYVTEEISKLNIHTHENKTILDLITQGHLDVLSHFSVEEGRIKVNTDLWSTGEVSAYGAGSGTGTGGASGSLGGLANVGLWADEVPISDRIMVQLAGTTHWSSKLLSEIVGLDTVALGAYLVANSYAKQSYVDARVAELVGTKWTQDNTKIANWDSAFWASHTHANKSVLDGVTSELVTNWNLAFTNNHTHSNKAVIDSITQANLDVLAKLSIVDGNLKVDTNLWSTGEVSAYGAGSGTGGGGGLVSSVYGSAGLGGDYLDSDLTNTFNAYTINLINNNLTSALGRIGTLETNTPNVVWGVPTSQYSPLTINSVTRNLSVDGHTHSSFLDLQLKNIQGGDPNHRLELGFSARNYVNWYEYGGLWKFIQKQDTVETELFQINPVNILYKGNTVWHAGNDGAGSGLEADMLDGKHDIYFLYRDSQFNANNVDFNAVSYNSGYGITIQPIHTPNFSGATNNPFMNYGQMVNFDGGTNFPFRMAFNFGDSSLWVQSAGYQTGATYNYSSGALWKKIAFTTDNVASATKLANTRTIWGQNFNGEGNVSGPMTSVTSISMNGSLSGVTTGNFSGEVRINVGGGANNALYLNGDMRFGPDYSGARTGLFKYDTTFDGLLIDTWGSGKQVRIGGSKVVLGVGEGGQLGNVLIGTSTDAGYKLDVNGTGRFTDSLSAVRVVAGFDAGAAGSVSCSNWFRSNGATGWYNQTYGGGMTMEDYTYVKVSHNKSLWVNGNIVGTGEITAYSASDRRLKTDIHQLTSSLDIVNKLNPVSYKWNSLAKELNPLKDNNTDYGLIAQELECVMPELVHSIYDGKYKSIDYVKLIPHLICAIKQLKMEVDHLKKTYY